MSSPEITHVAAVDLGSNSFHMIVMQLSDGRLQLVDKIKESIRLATGLDSKNRLSEDAMDRALDCLSRFGQRLRDMPKGSVRIVGTNTLRKAKNSTEFLIRAEQAIGHPIDIISGREEARLIYLGVSHSLEDDNNRRLVMDIGGGSTEFILGHHFKPKKTESLHMGCVVFSDQFFKKGKIDAGSIAKAELAALMELEVIEKPYLKMGWETAIGASGTILAIHNVISAQGWSENGITKQALKKLSGYLIDVGHINNISLQGLTSDRVSIFPGGVAILSAAFQSLKIDRMFVSDGALREGAIYDLLGRIRKEDVREGTVETLEQHYRINLEQANRVEKSALDFFKQSKKSWKLRDYEQQLHWATRLHEIGISISYSLYHKHGYYLLCNLDMPGFSRLDQQLLATIVRGHRRKFPQTEISQLPKPHQTTAERLCVLLRLSVVLHRGQSDIDLPKIKLILEKNNIKLTFPEGWLDEHPLTEADLKQESGYLSIAGYRLKYE
ncbi:MAG: exopolyphosphatase [Gammaproteobacteria bacterium]